METNQDDLFSKFHYNDVIIIIIVCVDDYERHISEIFIHELFEAKNKNASYYDVAVLVLDEPIAYSDDEDQLVSFDVAILSETLWL